jgi:hypothetical protein
MPPTNPNDHHVRIALLEDWRERTETTLAEMRDDMRQMLRMQAESAGAQKSTDRTIKLGLAVLGVLISAFAAAVRAGGH